MWDKYVTNSGTLKLTRLISRRNPARWLYDQHRDIEDKQPNIGYSLISGMYGFEREGHHPGPTLGMSWCSLRDSR